MSIGGPSTDLWLDRVFFVPLLNPWGLLKGFPFHYTDCIANCESPKGASEPFESLSSAFHSGMNGSVREGTPFSRCRGLACASFFYPITPAATPPTPTAEFRSNNRLSARSRDSSYEVVGPSRFALAGSPTFTGSRRILRALGFTYDVDFFFPHPPAQTDSSLKVKLTLLVA